MTDLNITIFGLDDDVETLDIMEHILLDNGIGNYKLFYREDDFYQNFNEDVHIAIIDHFMYGEPRGFEIMKKIFEHNKTREVIDCRVIVISGQRNHETTKFYLNQGAKGYIDKDDRNFSVLLIEYLNREIREVTKILTILKKQEAFISQYTKKKDEPHNRTAN